MTRASLTNLAMVRELQIEVLETRLAQRVLLQAHRLHALQDFLMRLAVHHLLGALQLVGRLEALAAHCPDFLNSTLGEDTAGAHNGDPATQSLRLVHVVGGQQDGPALAAERTDKAPDLAP